MPHRHLTLFVPGLFGPSPPGGVDAREAARVITEGMEIPALEEVLGRADRFAAGAEENPEAMLCRHFGVAPREGGDWPVAALTRLVDAGAGAAQGGTAASAEAAHGRPVYMRADPVYVRADMREVRLFDARHFRLTRDEAQALARGVEDALGGGWTLEVLHEQRWYLRLDGPPRLRTHPPSGVAGARLEDFLPQGEEAVRWRRRLNEVQMVLHSSPVNAAREARGELPVNSLWFWGAGALPPVPQRRWDRVWSEDPAALGLARLTGSDAGTPPADGAAWLNHAGPGRHLVTLEGGYLASRLSEVENWQAFIAKLERDWMIPLRRALRERRLGSLDVIAEHGDGFRTVRRHLRRWWRRPRPLWHFANPR